MAIERLTTEGDFVVRGVGRDLLRFHMTDESMYVTANENHPGQRHVVICDISEAKELRDWLTRRIEEPI